MQLRIRQPDGAERLVPLEPGRPLQIGTFELADIQISGDGVQPIHCGIRFRDGAYEVVAPPGSSGVEVNGDQVHQAALEEGDQLRIGLVRLAVVSDAFVLKTSPAEAAAPAPSVAAASPPPPSPPPVVTAAPSRPAAVSPPAAELPIEELSLAPLDEAPKGASVPAKPAAPPAPVVSSAPAEELQLVPLESPASPASVPTKPAPAGKSPTAAQPAPTKPPAAAGKTPSAKPAPAPAPTAAASTASKTAGPASAPSPSSAATPSVDELSPLDELTPLEATTDLGGFSGDLFGGLADPLAAGSGGLAALGDPAAFGGPSGLASPDMAGQGMPGFGPSLAGPSYAAGGAVTPSSAATVAAPRPPSKIAKVFTIVGIVLFLIPVVGVVALVLARLPTAEDDFQAALQAYDAGNFATAAQQFDSFVQTYPESLQADEARIRRSLARLRPALAGGDPAAAFQAVVRAVRDLGPLASAPQVQKLVEEHAPPLAAALVQKAGASSTQLDHAEAAAAVAQALAAVAWVRQRTPPAVQAAAGVDDLEVQVTALDRQVKQSQALRDATSEIRSATKEGQLAEAYAVQRRLLAEYPALAGHVSLQETLQATAAAEQERVRLTATEALAQPSAPVDQRWSLTAFPSSRQGPEEPAGAPLIVTLHDPTSGTAYALSARSGKVLWRREIGLQSQVGWSLRGEPTATLTVDVARGEIARVVLKTGVTAWRRVLGPLAGFPVLVENLVCVALRDGRVQQFDGQTGELLAEARLPQTLSAGLTYEAQGKRLWIPADEAHLYLLAADELRPQGVVYLGQGYQSVSTPPALVGELAVLIAEEGLHASRLLVCDQGNPPRLLESVELPGLVMDVPVVSGSQWIAQTSDGDLHAFDAQGGERKAGLRRAALRKGDPNPFRLPFAENAFLSVSGETLWHASATGLRSFSLPLRDPVTALATWFPQQTLAQPLAVGAAGLLVAKRDPASADLHVSSYNDLAAPPRFSTHLGACAASDVYPLGESLWLAPADGRGIARLDGKNVGSMLEYQRPAADFSQPVFVPLTADRAVVGSRGGATLWTVVAGESLTFRPTPLPGKLAAAVALDGEQALLVFEGGGVCRFQAVEGKVSSDLVLVSFAELGSPAAPRWALATAPGKMVLGHGKQLRLVDCDPSQTTITWGQTAALSAPWDAPPVVAGGRVWGRNHSLRVSSLSLSDMTASEQIVLESPLAVGPISIGEAVVTGTRDGQIRLWRDGQPVWSVASPIGPILGATLNSTGQLLVASANGQCQTLDLDQGSAIGPALLGSEPLVAGPWRVGDKSLVMARDGALLEVPASATSSSGGPP